MSNEAVSLPKAWPSRAKSAVLHVISLAHFAITYARGWFLVQTAKAFWVEPDTVGMWLKGLDESGPASLVQMAEPVNKFPDFVRHIVCRLKAICPSLGKVKIAQMLAKAGLHLCATTIGRMLKAKTPAPDPTNVPSAQTEQAQPAQVVTAQYPSFPPQARAPVNGTTLRPDRRTSAGHGQQTAGSLAQRCSIAESAPFAALNSR